MSHVLPAKMPAAIIGKGHKDKHFTFRLLSGKALEVLESKLPSLSRGQAVSAKRALLYFEYLLRLTKHPPITSVLELNSPDFLRKRVATFAKACFGHPSPSKRQKTTRRFILLRKPRFVLFTRYDPIKGS